MLKIEIQNNWKTDIIGYAQNIESLENTNYPAWTVRLDNSYGVAIPYSGVEEINESFASARIRSANISVLTGSVRSALVLTTDNETIKEPFSVLCEALIDPGENGSRRVLIESSPVTWWKEWKELLGNKNIDERIYDLLGELCVFKYALQNYEDCEWNGPNGASYDIETNERFIEVKSTINRQKTEITISNQFQLFPQNKPLAIVFCRFEPTVMSGISIDGILNDFVELGYNVDLINSKIESRGFEKGMSARRKTFLLHEMLMFIVDDSFPRITPGSFVGGVLPGGITKITYTVDLSGRIATSLLLEDYYDIQNN